MAEENIKNTCVINTSNEKKKKIQEWYQKNIHENHIDEKLQKFNDVRLDTENVVGKGLVTIFVPALLPVCPAIAKYSKKIRSKIFEYAKKQSIHLWESKTKLYLGMIY